MSAQGPTASQLHDRAVDGWAEVILQTLTEEEPSMHKPGGLDVPASSASVCEHDWIEISLKGAEMRDYICSRCPATRLEKHP